MFIRSLLPLFKSPALAQAPHMHGRSWRPQCCLRTSQSSGCQSRAH